MTTNPQRMIAGKVCAATGNLLVGLYGAVFLFAPSPLRFIELVLMIAAYVALNKRGTKVLDSIFKAAEKL